MNLAKLSAILQGAFGHVAARRDPVTGRIKSSAAGIDILKNSGVTIAGNRKGVSLFDFSTPASWAFIFGGAGGSIAAASSAYDFNGKPALAFSPGSSASDGIKRTLAAGSTFSVQPGAIMRLIVDIPSTVFALAPSFTLKLSDDASPGTNYASFIVHSSKLRPGTNVITIKAGEDGTTDYHGDSWTYSGSFTSGNTWGKNFNFVQILCGNITNQTVYFRGFYIGAKDQPRVALTFDYIGANVLEVCAPTLAAYGWNAGVMMDGGAGYFTGATLAKINTLVNTYGWSVGAMGVTHTSYNSNGRDIGADYDTCAAEMIAAGLPKPTTWAYPQNASSVSNDAILAARGVLWRRGANEDILHTAVGVVPHKNGGMICQGFSQHLAQNYNTGTANQQVKNRIDQLIATGGVLSLFTHNESALSTDWALGGDLSQWFMLLDYCKANGVKIMSPEAAVADINNAWPYI